MNSSTKEGVLVQWCNPPILPPELSDGLDLGPSRYQSLERHDLGFTTSPSTINFFAIICPYT